MILHCGPNTNLKRPMIKGTPGSHQSTFAPDASHCASPPTRPSPCNALGLLWSRNGDEAGLPHLCRRPAT
jgi:hypothetical protein